MLVKTSVIFIITLRLSFCHNETSENTVVDCVINIIETNFIYTPTILMRQSILHDNINNYEFDVNFTKKLIERNIPRIISQELIDVNAVYMQKGYILAVLYYEDCNTLLSLLNEVFGEHIKYLVIISDYDNDKCEVTLQDVGRNTSINDVTYVLSSEEDIDVTTFIPRISHTTCVLEHDLTMTLLSKCSLMENFDAFPDKKPQDYMKCPLKIGMATLFPFANITNKESLKTYDHLQAHEIYGSDIEILRIMAKKFNFTPDFYYVTRYEENPFVDTVFVTFIVNGSLDICAGGMYRIYGDLVDYSGVYGRQAAVWIYPVKRDERSWQILIDKVNGLYIFIVFYFFYSITWKLFSMFDKQTIPVGRLLLKSWGALIGTSSLQKVVTVKQKILNIFYLVMCIHLSAYISVQMYSFLTILAPPATLKTNEDIVQSGLQPYLMPATKYFNTDPAYISFADTALDCDSFIDCEEKSLKFNGVTVVTDSMYVVWQAETAVNDEAAMLRVNENMLIAFHEFLLRKGLPITKKFRAMLTLLEESGINNRLYDEGIGILITSKSKSAAKNIMSSSYSCGTGCSITLKQSAGAFYVWMFGCGLSFCIFVMEVLLKRESIFFEN